jgi:hypothetical protein
MKNNSTPIAWGLRIVVAVLFIVSAIAKMYPSPYFAISTFEVKQLYPMGFSDSVAPFFSRILIGIEMALGLLLLQNHWLKRFIIPATIALLVVFIGHLSYETFISGNSGNCGCFGELIPMTPVEAIIKNVVAVGLLWYLNRLLPKGSDAPNFWVLTTVLFASILGIFMMAPIQPPAPEFTVSQPTVVPQDTTTVAIDTPDTLAAPVAKTKVDTLVTAKVVQAPKEPKKVSSGYANLFPTIDQGKKILCYFVPGCDHCRDAAKELTQMRKTNPNMPPISIIFMNEEADLIPKFFEETGATYPYQIIEIIPFWNQLGRGKDTPGVKYLWNGNEVKYWWGIDSNQFKPAELQTVLKKSYEELKKSNPKL